MFPVNPNFLIDTSSEVEIRQAPQQALSLCKLLIGALILNALREFGEDLKQQAQRTREIRKVEVRRSEEIHHQEEVSRMRKSEQKLATAECIKINIALHQQA